MLAMCLGAMCLGVDSTNTSVSSITLRGLTFGFEYYGCFSRAMYSLFQVMTGESWSEAVARPTIFGDSAMGSGVFYITFIIATQIVLVNVVVAVMLEKMMDDPDADKTSSSAQMAVGSRQSSYPSPWCEGGRYANAKVPSVLSSLRSEVSQARAELEEMKAIGATLEATITKVTASLQSQGRQGRAARTETASPPRAQRTTTVKLRWDSTSGNGSAAPQTVEVDVDEVGMRKV
mmetsp:Transcript_36379/g.106444  ORF Transcript_36379/g.106444 Transcript_36379/m.106444 type:complete len:233 (+) Transcript_36379:84-782(+)